MPFLVTILIILGLYLLLILGPALTAAVIVFRRSPVMGLEEICGTEEFAPYAAALQSAEKTLSLLSPTRVTVRAADNTELCADYYDRHAGKTVILLHGYRSDPMVNFALQAECFAAHGWNVLLVSQRAHGVSGGKRTCFGLKEQFDLENWVRWAASQPESPRIAVYGISMGAATAAYASDKLDPAVVRCLIPDCGFTSPYLQLLQECRRRHLPGFLLMPLIRLFARLFYGFDIRTPVTDALSRTEIPAFFLHGTADETVPYAQGVTNYEACASPRKVLFSAEGAGHTLAFPAERERAETELFRFLQDACGFENT
nr:alpha/beta hydrolase [Lachnospiraceae bacterium]